MLRHEGERRGEKKGDSFVYAFALMDLLDFILFIFISKLALLHVCVKTMPTRLWWGIFKKQIKEAAHFHQAQVGS